MPLERRLLMLAESSNRDDGGLASRRRAVSTAYYAVFHALARLCAEEFVGVDPSTRTPADYERVYRAVEHGSMKSKFLNTPRELDTIRQIGNRFVLLQSKRHDADYRPTDFHFTEAESSDLIEAARYAIDLIDSLSSPDRRALAVRLVIRDRTS